MSYDVQVLVLDSNQLTSLPTDIGQLVLLEKLSVKKNALITVPVSINQLQKLYVLDLSSNSLAELTAAVAECSQLEELNVSNNDLQVCCITTAAVITSCPQTIQDIHGVETCNVGVIMHGNNDMALNDNVCQSLCRQSHQAYNNYRKSRY